MDDQLLELIGLYSSFHIGKIQVSVAEPIRIGQAKNIQVYTHTGAPLVKPHPSHYNY